jgi:SAM-dependent methyltransferase
LTPPSPTHHGEFRDPAVAALYDLLFGWTREDDYFVRKLAEESARDIADLGCGTGRLAIALAALGYRVTGADPAAASLSLARAKPGADAVVWLEGSAEMLPADSFDGAVMTGHVAQFMVTDDEFAAALAALHRALRPGGRLLFDSRDPIHRHWSHWTKAESLRSIPLPGGGICSTWVEVDDVREGRVSFTHHYDFPHAEHRVATATMRFRTESELRHHVAAAGFTIESVYGGWDRDAIGHPDGELLVTARR